MVTLTLEQLQAAKDLQVVKTYNDDLTIDGVYLYGGEDFPLCYVKLEDITVVIQ